MRLWLVWRPIGETVEPVLGGAAGTRFPKKADPQIIPAESAREAVERFSCSVLDLRRGMDLHVIEMPEEAQAFHRVYSVQEDPRVWLGVSDPVTLDRPRARVKT